MRWGLNSRKSAAAVYLTKRMPGPWYPLYAAFDRAGAVNEQPMVFKVFCAGSLLACLPSEQL